MDPQFLSEWVIGLLTLTALEIVLGIDNIVVISIISEKVPQDQRAKARQLGLIFALVSRLALLSMVSFLVHLKEPIFTAMGKGISVKDLILIVGGLFLMGKATSEIFRFVEAHEEKPNISAGKAAFNMVIGQILVFDLIFSIDSILTAVGLTENLYVMMIAVVLAVIVMAVFVNQISEFVHANPAIKMLALSFLVLIGFLLIIEGFGSHVDKGYVYFAMAYALIIELLNRRRRKKEPGRFS